MTGLSKELSEMLNGKNRIAAIEQELLHLTPEQHYFGEYYSTYVQAPKDEVKGLSSQKILSLWLEYEQHAQQESKLGLLQKISILFRFNRSALKVFLQAPELVIPYLQRQFYVVRRQELMEERAQLEKKLEQYAFDQKMEELTEKSLRLFRAELSEKFHWKEPRKCFETRDFRGRSQEFNREYPIILSTTYSIKGTLNFEHTYSYEGESVGGTVLPPVFIGAAVEGIDDQEFSKMNEPKPIRWLIEHAENNRHGLLCICRRYQENRSIQQQ